MENNLCESGYNCVWLRQENADSKLLNVVKHKRFADISMQKWYNETNVNSQYVGYKMFKDKLN